MTTLVRCVNTEFQKFRHSMLLPLHTFLPLLSAAAIGAYFRMTSWSSFVAVSSFLILIATAFPFMTGIVVGIVCQTEDRAGHYQNLLGIISSRTAIWFGQLFYLLLYALFALILAFAVFSGIYGSIPLVVCLWAVPVLLVTALPLYLIHLMVGFKFGRGASFALGIAGTLAAALLRTGLGDRIWAFVPWAWGVRAVSCIALSAYQNEAWQGIRSEIYSGAFCAICLTITLFTASIFWFYRFEGGRSTDA